MDKPFKDVEIGGYLQKLNGERYYKKVSRTTARITKEDPPTSLLGGSYDFSPTQTVCVMAKKWVGGSKTPEATEEEPVYQVVYHNNTYTDSCVNGSTPADIKATIKKLQQQMRDYNRFAKKFGWKS